MKSYTSSFALLALTAALTLPSAIQGATYTKANNTNSLDQATSWGGTAPGSGDLATWSGTYAAGGATNALSAAFAAAVQPSWGGISVGAIAGPALTTNIIGTVGTIGVAGTNITAATETVVNGFNVVTMTTVGNHGFEPGMAVTISGVTPAAYNGTFTVAGVNSATQFTFTNATGGLGAGTAFGAVSGIMYIGGTTAAAGMFTNGASGINVASGAPSVVLNVTNVAFNGNQTWNLAPGKVLRFTSGGGASFANGRATSSGNDGNIEITGGGVVSLNPGSGSGQTDINSFAQFTGTWQVDAGSTLRSLRNGASAFTSSTAANAITLNGGILAVGGGQGDVGNWTWNVPITLNASTTSFVADQNVAGTGRYLLLNGTITGSGNLVFIEPLVAASTFTSQDLGFIVAGANTMTGTVTIGGPLENGVSNRLSYVRLGAPGTAIGGTGVGNGGSLGTGNIVNNGVLTTMFTTSTPLPNTISGTGTLRLGSLASAYIGAAYQNLQLQAVNTYIGPTIINAGTLSLAAGSSIANSSSIIITTNSVNNAAVINTFDVSALAGGFTTAPGQTLSLNGGQLTGNFNFAAGSTNLLAPAGSNTVGTLNVTGNLNLSGGTNTIVLDINNLANDQVAIGGNLTASGVTTLQFVPPVVGLNAGTYTVITASGTLSASPANFRIAGLTAGPRPQTFSIAVSGNSVNLVVVGSPGNLTWVGDGLNNVWSTATTSNWWNNLNSTKDVFYANDIVAFDDSGSNTPAVKLTGTLMPSAVVVNSTHDYAFSGTGQISGPASLTVSGTGKLTLTTSNNFSGPVDLNAGGTLAITNETALGGPLSPTANSLTLDNASALLVTNTLTLGFNTNRGIIIGTGGGTLIVSNGSTLTVSNVIGDLTGVSPLTKTGNGTLLLYGNNNYGGGTVLDGGGMVVCGSGHALGLKGSWSPGFTLLNGSVDINGQGNYFNASLGVSNNFLFTGTAPFLTFGGEAGATTELKETGSSTNTPGFGTFVQNSASIVIYYNGANNPGKAVISAPWYTVGTGATLRTNIVSVDSSAATPVGLEFKGQMSYQGYEGKVATVQKVGPGVMEISCTNYFPNLEITEGTLLVNNDFALGADRSPNYGGFGTGSPHQMIVDGGTLDLNGYHPAIGALSDNGLTTGVILNGSASPSTLILGYSASNQVANATYAGVIANGTGAVSLNKIGTNSQTLAGLNTYSGLTTVSNGTLVIGMGGQIGLGTSTSTVTAAGGTLGGSGIINAPVIVQAGGTLAPGAGASILATLTLTTNLTLGGTNLMAVSKDTATNDLVVLNNGTLHYGGTLMIATNLTTVPLVLGDSFKLFSAPASTGNFSSIAGSPGTGLGWSFNPASGTVTVVNGLASNPTNITYRLTGNTMTLTWPADHLGWLLQTQTNSLTTGIGVNWMDVSGSDASTQAVITIHPENPTVFFRLRHP